MVVMMMYTIVTILIAVFFLTMYLKYKNKLFLIGVAGMIFFAIAGGFLLHGML